VAIAFAALFGAGRPLWSERQVLTGIAAPPDQARTVSRPEAAKGMTAEQQAPPPPTPPVQVRPRSLRNTEVDGALRVDPQGNLRVDPEVLRLFDYFLTALGEEPEEVIRTRIVAAIRARLDGRAEGQAVALLDRYLAYRAGGSSLQVDVEDRPAARLSALRRIRREHFGEPLASELFGMEEREEEAVIEEGRVASDATLAPEEHEARIAQIEATLPDAVREARAAARRPLRQQAEEAAMREAGATAREIYDHRVATIGIEAADRLAELDRRRAEWNLRVAVFRAERERIEAIMSDPAQRDAAEAARLAREFTLDEQLRVRAILRMTGG
jgi:lipase chaperone LimK